MYDFLKDIKTIIAGNELREIYANNVIRAIAFGLVGIFVPIYFLKIGYPLVTVLKYLVLSFIFFLIFSPLVIPAEQKFGLKKTIAIGCLTASLFLLLISIFGKEIKFLPIFAIFYGFGQAFYWVPLKANFSLQIRKGKAGQSLGVLGSLVSLVGILTPIIGGFILNIFNFEILVLFSSVLLLISVFPLFLTSDYSIKPKRRLVELLTGKQNELFFEFFSEGIIYGAQIIWPVYLYYFKSEYFFIGIISTIAGFAVALFKYFYGKVSDRISKIKLLKFGSIFTFLLWFVVVFAQNVYLLMLLSFMMGFFLTMHSLPLEAFFSEHSKDDPVKWMTLRELGLCTGRIVALLIFFFTFSFQFIFISAAIASLFFLTVKPIKLEIFDSSKKLK